MSVALFQLVLGLAAGYLLWRLWRSLAAEDGLTRGIVFVGFFGRALAGLSLFWISYLRLPFLRSLQLGDGLWFFGNDATYYMPTAAAAARGGLDAIIGVPPGASSVAYVQTLALFGLLFGIVASVALLLNLFCYLGSCVAIVKMRKLTPAGRVPGAVALAAISLSPSAVLWSLQPLKDTLFQFLIVAFVAGCAMWQRAWRTRPSPVMLAGAAAILFATLYAISGIRWYFAFAALAAVFVFFFLVAVTVPKKAIALAAGLTVFAALTQAFLYGAGAYTPPRVTAMLSFSTPLETRIAALSPGAFAGDLDKVRDNFDRAGGDTSIGVGKALTGMEAKSATAPVTVAAAEGAPFPPQEESSERPTEEWTEARDTHSKSISAPESEPSSQAAASESAPEEDEPAASRTDTGVVASAAQTEHQPAPAKSDSTSSAAAEAPRAPAAPTGSQAATPAPAQTIPRERASAETTPRAPAPATPASPAQGQQALAARDGGSGSATTTASRSATEVTEQQPPPRKTTATQRPRAPRRKPGGAAVRPAAPSVASAEPAPQAAPHVPAEPVKPQIVVATPVAAPQAASPPVPPPVVLPQSIAGRVVTGMIAVLVPRSVADRFNLIEIGGGKGLLWFTDVDTLVLDAIVLFGLFYLGRHLRWATFRNPTFWLVVLVGVLVGVPLAYTITNFGTLFRLRMMLYTAAALMPLALALAATHREVIMSEVAAVPARNDDDAQDTMKPGVAS